MASTADLLTLKEEIDKAHDRLIDLLRDYCLVQREVYREQTAVEMKVTLHHEGARGLPVRSHPLCNVMVDADGPRTEDDSVAAGSGC